MAFVRPSSQLLRRHLGVELDDSKDSTAFAAADDCNQHPVGEVGETFLLDALVEKAPRTLNQRHRFELGSPKGWANL